MRRALALALVAALAFPATGLAQAAPATTQTDQAPSIDLTKLGVSLERIRRELAEATRETMSSDGQRLHIRVDVFGTAPPLDLIPEDFDLTFGPVPRSSPTHREHIDFVTPIEFRSPAVPFSDLAVWAGKKLWEKSKQARCEEELKEYRALVMQGVWVAAPRCAR